MKNNGKRSINQNNENNFSCGNCWGHQEYDSAYKESKIDVRPKEKGHFLSRFIKKYLS